MYLDLMGKAVLAPVEPERASPRASLGFGAKCQTPMVVRVDPMVALRCE
jgi:hypothetical protein